MQLMRQRIFLTGVGGQGTLTATSLLAQAALLAGMVTVAGEVHGMAQRGGVVESAILLGGYRSLRVDYGEADLLLGFEALETLRGLPYLRKGGIIVSSLEQLPPLSVALGNADYPDTDFIRTEVMKVAKKAWFIPCREIGEKAGSPKSGNTALLGAVCAVGAVPFDVSFLHMAIDKFMPVKIRAVNQRALELGAKYIENENAI